MAWGSQMSWLSSMPEMFLKAMRSGKVGMLLQERLVHFLLSSRIYTKQVFLKLVILSLPDYSILVRLMNFFFILIRIWI